jgi:UDP-N-acetylglucosamine acyltransferase
MNNVSISPKAIIGNNCDIREYSVIEDDVIIGDNVEIGPSAFIGKGSRIGDGVRIHHGASIAVWPNSISYKGEFTTTEIGEGTFIKGNAIVCRGTTYAYKTVIGKNCYIMNNAHIGHDNIIGDEVILTAYVALGGHVEIGSYTNVGGMTAVHQFSKIGKYAMVEMCSKIQKDVPPFVMAARVPTRYVGLNFRGLRRRGFTSERSEYIKDAYRILYDSGLNISDAIQKITEDMEMNDDILEIVNFIKKSSRGIIRK